MKLRALDEAALIHLHRALEDGRNGELSQDGLSDRLAELAVGASPVGGEVSDAAPPTNSRLDLGRFLVDLMKSAPPEIIANRSMWTWLAVHHFSIICPPGSRVGEDARYLLSDNPMRYYRHLLYGPYLAAMTHHKEAKGLAVLLGNPPDAPGDIWEQIASRQELISSRKIVEIIGLLYYDPQRESYKAGVATSDAGGIRRFVRVMQQLDCTWDLWEIPVDELLRMLPLEFDRFLNS